MSLMYRWCLLGATALLVSFAIGFATASQKNNALYRFARHLYLSSTSAPESTKTAHWRTMVSQFEALKGPSKIYMLGDSITEGGQWAELFPDASIANRGISGDRIKGVLARVNQIPDGATVFLMIGTNDVAANTPVDQIEKSYLELIDTLAAKSTLIVQSTLFTQDDERNAAIAHLNSAILGTCASAPTKCEYVDINSVIAPDGYLPSTLTFDGQHLNGDGYLKWRQVIAPIIERVAGAQSS